MKSNKIPTSLILEKLIYHRESVTFTHRYNGKLAGSTNRADGYVRIKINGKYYKAHRLVWQIENGDTDLMTDHKDGDRANNNIDNLRVVSSLENSRNQGLNSRNKSGFCGVRWIESKKRWIAEAVSNGNRVRIGTFLTKVDAVAARIAFNKVTGFHKNHGKKRQRY